MDLIFTKADRLVSLPVPPPRRFLIIRWPDGRTSVREVYSDGTVGPWAEYPPEAS